jgi:DNA ligase (NAD+)
MNDKDLCQFVEEIKNIFVFKEDKITISDFMTKFTSIYYDASENTTFTSIETMFLDFMSKCNYSYYNTSESVISDDTYDAIKRILRNNNIEVQVGSLPSAETLKRNRQTTKDHHFTELVGSLRDYVSLTEIRQFFEKITTKLKKDWYFCTSVKIDGNSVTLTFNPDGTLLDAITRGEDNMGVDLTHMFKNVVINTNLIKHIFTEGLLSIKCEAVVTYDALTIVNQKRVSETGKKPFANGRSAITGILANDNSIDYAQYINLIPIDIRITNKDIDREEAVIYMTQITSDNPIFLDFPFETFRGGEQDAYEFIEKYKLKIESSRSELPYMCDGVVVEIINNDVRSESGWTGVYPNYSLAYKFEFFEAITTLTAIEFDFGYKTGRITPAVRFENVIHNGATFNRVSLSSYLRYSKLSPQLGQFATFEYRMDTLGYIKPIYVDGQPKINIDYLNRNGLTPQPFQFIEECPICNSKLKIPEDPSADAFVHCINPDCKGNIMAFFIRFLDVKRAKGIAEKTIEKFVKVGILKQPSDLFKLTRDQILSVDGFLSKSADIILTEINSIKSTLVDWQLIAGLPIESVGEDRASAITREIPLISLINAIDQLGVEDVILGILELEIPNIGEKSARAITEAVFQYKDELLEIMTICAVKETSKQALRIAITGSINFEGKRNGLIKYLNGLGHKVADISKETDYLVCNTISNSDKCNMAAKYDIPIINEECLLTMLK